jgi:hypothetical protein
MTIKEELIKIGYELEDGCNEVKYSKLPLVILRGNVQWINVEDGLSMKRFRRFRIMKEIGPCFISKKCVSNDMGGGMETGYSFNNKLASGCIMADNAKSVQMVGNCDSNRRMEKPFIVVRVTNGSTKIAEDY